MTLASPPHAVADMTKSQQAEPHGEVYSIHSPYSPPSAPSSITHIDVAQEVLSNEISALTSMKDSLMNESLGPSFTKVIEAILSIKGRVIVMGMGKSGHVARKIAATLASTGQPALFVHPGEASHGDLGMITKSDLVLALSNSGETMELANVIEYTRRFSIPLVSMTRREKSTLTQLADIALTIPDCSEACPMGLAPTTSTTMMMALGDAIAIALLKSRSFSSADFKVYHPGGNLGAKLHRVKDKMHRGDSLPLIEENMPVTQVILTITQKSLGCAGVVNKQGCLIGIVTDGDLRRHMEKDFFTLQAKDIMTKNPTTIDPTMLMTEALALMNQKKITALFVVSNDSASSSSSHGQPLGIIHVHDFLRAGVV